MLALLNKQLGLSHGKSVKLLGMLFEGLSIARATSARSVARTATRCQAAYQQIRQAVRGASEVAPDETGWRVEGRSAWLHAFVSQRATCYVIDPTRSHQPAERLLGIDWSGTLVHDGLTATEQADPSVVKAVVEGDWAIDFLRDPTPGGLRHVGIYAFRPDFLQRYAALPRTAREKERRLEQMRALDHGHRIRAVPARSWSCGIDTPQDYAAFVKRCAREGS